MPIVNNKVVENIKPIAAYSKGYLLKGEYDTHAEWVSGNLKERDMITFVYVDGVYRGTATRKMKLADIVDKFKI